MAGKSFSVVDKIIYTPNLDHSPDPKGVGHALYTHLEKYKDRVLQIDGLTGRKDTAAIVFSSGTSGVPKANCISHFTMLSQAANIISFGYNLDVTLTFMSFYWGICSTFWVANILSGTSKLIVSQFTLEIVQKAINEYEPSFIFLSTSHAIKMYKGLCLKDLNTTCVKDISLGGACMTQDEFWGVRSLFPTTRVCLSYGQTEVCGYITNFSPSDVAMFKFVSEKPTSSGGPIPGMTYKIVDLKTEERLGPNRIGELRVKTDLQLNGYYKASPSESSLAWDAEGWLHTGDIAYYDEDTCFFIVDRLKEVLKFRTYQLAPVTIESVLLTHPLVKSAVVIGKHHQIDGDQPMAVVVLERPRCLSEEEIERYVEERVDDQKRLRGGVIIVDDLPTTPNGKIYRGKVKALYQTNK